MKPKLKLTLTRKFHLMIVAPLIAISMVVTGLTWGSLETNADRLADALSINARAHEVFSLLLIQENTSKAILMDPDRLADYSEKKLSAYDQHQALLASLRAEIADPAVQQKLQEVARLDEQHLRPADTQILEQLFVEPNAARQLYFTAYEPHHLAYEHHIEDLVRYATAEAEAAAAEMRSKNQLSLAEIGVVLLLGVVAIAATIQVLARRVEQSQANLHSLLRGMEEGLFFFDRAGHIAAERSQALEEILPGCSADTDLASLLARFGGADAESVAICLEMLWPPPGADDGFHSEFEDTITFLPRRLMLADPDGERTIHLTYKAHHGPSGALERVYVSVRDMTEAIRSEQQARRQQERVDRISRVVANPEAFERFTGEMDRLIATIAADLGRLAGEPGACLDELKRHLHTLKGSLGIYQFLDLAGRLHALEEQLLEEAAVTDAFQASWAIVPAQWAEEVADIRAVLGLDCRRADVVPVSAGKLTQLRRYARRQRDLALCEQVEALVRRPLVDWLGCHAEQLRQLSERREEQSFALVIDPTSCDISAAEARQIDGAMGHLLRNCADHGIETAEARERAGKPAAGTIQVSCQRSPGRLLWLVEDDGQGIDGDKLARKMAAAGAWSAEQLESASEADKQALIFVPSLSARDEVCETSGRGVGMDAVRQDILAAGGAITVESYRGIGTRFLITLPAPPDDLSLPAAAESADRAAV